LYRFTVRPWTQRAAANKRLRLMSAFHPLQTLAGPIFFRSNVLDVEQP
jgi:hypothetical protein